MRYFFLNMFFTLCVFSALSLGRGVMADEHYKYDVAVCTIFRNDARFLREWIEFHKLVGVQHFWLFNNLSEDNYLEVLRTYLENGTVDLIQWPYENENRDHWFQIQNEAIEEGIRLAKGEAKWLAVIDTDEFLFPSERDKLMDVLIDYEEFGGVCVNWLVFGTSGVKRIPENRLMIEILLKRSNTHFQGNRVAKTIFRPERVSGAINSHRMLYFNPFFPIDENQIPLIFRKGNKTKQTNVKKLRINHYWTRDEDFFSNKKISRRYKNRKNDQMIDNYESFNDEYDDTILRFVPRLREAMIPEE